MKPSFSPWLLVAGEVLAGALTGTIIAYVAGRIVGIRGAGENATGFDDLAAVLTTLLIAYPLGVTLGNYVYNRRVRGQASFWLALVGSVVGVIVMMGLAQPLRLNENTALLWGAMGVVPPALAALAEWAGCIQREK